jgi:hypothetical protein
MGLTVARRGLFSIVLRFRVRRALVHRAIAGRSRCDVRMSRTSVLNPLCPAGVGDAAHHAEQPHQQHTGCPASELQAVAEHGG